MNGSPVDTWVTRRTWLKWPRPFSFRFPWNSSGFVLNLIRKFPTDDRRCKWRLCKLNRLGRGFPFHIWPVKPDSSCPFRRLAKLRKPWTWKKELNFHLNVKFHRSWGQKVMNDGTIPIKFCNQIENKLDLKNCNLCVLWTWLSDSVTLANLHTSSSFVAEPSRHGDPDRNLSVIVSFFRLAECP